MQNCTPYIFFSHYFCQFDNYIITHSHNSNRKRCVGSRNRTKPNQNQNQNQPQTQRYFSRTNGTAHFNNICNRKYFIFSNQLEYFLPVGV